VTADTGYIAPVSGATGVAGIAGTPRIFTTRVIKKPAVKNKPINVGTIATVTVSASDETSTDDIPYGNDNSAFGLSTTKVIIGGILLLLLIRR
jgi:hypothetical protein